MITAAFPPAFEFLAHWGKQLCAFQSPLQPCSQSGMANPHCASSVNQKNALAIEIYENIVALIARLLGWRGPRNILGLIALGVILAFNGHSQGPFPNVAKEGRKAITPFRANRNTPPAIVSEGVAVGIVAAGDHTTPNVVNRRIRPSMSGVSRSGQLASIATAGRCLAISKASQWHCSKATASALTFKHPMATPSIGKLPEYGQSSEDSTRANLYFPSSSRHG